MTDHDESRFSLSRWSRRKLAANREKALAGTTPATAPAEAVAAAPSMQDAGDAPAAAQVVPATAPGVAVHRDAQQPVTTGLPGSAGSPVDRRLTTDQQTLPPAAGGDDAALPTLESLTIESNYAPFMEAGVDDTTRRAALKKLFSDPHFNVMDGLDIYIDDYSKPDPLPVEMIRQLASARYILDPPATRVNEHGWVEDVPPDEAEALRDPAAGAAAEDAADAAPVADGELPAEPGVDGVAAGTDASAAPEGALASDPAPSQRVPAQKPLTPAAR